MKKEAQERADNMTMLHKLFGFDCYIPNAPVTRSNRISDYSYCVGIGTEKKKPPKERKQTAPNYRKMTIELLCRAKKPLTSAAIAERMGVSKSTAKRHLQDLFLEGFVKRMVDPFAPGNNLTYLYSTNEKFISG